MSVISERYEVFARRKTLDPLQHLGGVTATSSELAYAYAVSTFDEEKWRDMAVVPRSHIYSQTVVLG